MNPETFSEFHWTNHMSYSEITDDYPKMMIPVPGGVKLWFYTWGMTTDTEHFVFWYDPFDNPNFSLGTTKETNDWRCITCEGDTYVLEPDPEDYKDDGHPDWEPPNIMDYVVPIGPKLPYLQGPSPNPGDYSDY